MAAVTALLAADIARREVRSPPPKPWKYVVGAVLGNLVVAMLPAALAEALSDVFAALAPFGAAVGLVAGTVLAVLSHHKRRALMDAARAEQG